MTSKHGSFPNMDCMRRRVSNRGKRAERERQGTHKSDRQENKRLARMTTKGGKEKGKRKIVTRKDVRENMEEEREKLECNACGQSCICLLLLCPLPPV